MLCTSGCSPEDHSPKADNPASKPPHLTDIILIVDSHHITVSGHRLHSRRYMLKPAAEIQHLMVVFYGFYTFLHLRVSKYLIRHSLNLSNPPETWEGKKKHKAKLFIVEQKLSHKIRKNIHSKYLGRY